MSNTANTSIVLSAELDAICNAWDEGISGEFHGADEVFAELDEKIANARNGGKAIRNWEDLFK